MDIRTAQVKRQIERDRTIIDYHVGSDPGGLKCPLCGRWSPLHMDSPQGVRLECEGCGVITVMARVPLARAIRRRTA